MAFAWPALLAACAEAPTALPSSEQTVTAAPLASTGATSGSGSFTYDPGKRITVHFGDHRMIMPTNVVCDPSTTTYAVDQWDAACTPAKAPIKFTVSWGVENGQIRVSFSPDVRFVPSTSSHDWVILSLKLPGSMDPATGYAILWKDYRTGNWVDEGQTDSTQRSWSKRADNRVLRRLKHFSGYGSGDRSVEGDGTTTSDGTPVTVQ